MPLVPEEGAAWEKSITTAPAFFQGFPPALARRRDTAGAKMSHRRRTASRLPGGLGKAPGTRLSLEAAA
jgi:hypothetical protein